MSCCSQLSANNLRTAVYEAGKLGKCVMVLFFDNLHWQVAMITTVNYDLMSVDKVSNKLSH